MSNNNYCTIPDTISYSENTEYHCQFRRIFKIEQSSQQQLDVLYPNWKEFDKETLDECTYDSIPVTQTIDAIYAQTEDIVEFYELYEYAAALFISTDTRLGINVLFSYDYFAPFHEIYSNYINSGKVPVGKINALLFKLKK